MAKAPLEQSRGVLEILRRPRPRELFLVSHVGFPIQGQIVVG